MSLFSLFRIYSQMLQHLVQVKIVQFAVSQQSRNKHAAFLLQIFVLFGIKAVPPPQPQLSEGKGV
jgi:hypothetical protein